jgi:hypothetical protein
MKSRINPIHLTTIYFIIGMLVIPIFGLSLNNEYNVETELIFQEEKAYEHIKNQVNLGFRIPGTNTREECAEYFISEFIKIDNNFDYYLHNFTIQSIKCQNVLFKLNEKQDNIVILGAHYDTRKIAEKDPDPDQRNNPVPGANDGASGSAVLLELARIFNSLKNNLNCEIWFLFFDAEDQGGGAITGWDWCEGSQKFVEDIELFYNPNLESIDCMILLDMVGGENLKFIKESYSNTLLMEELFEIGQDLGYNQAFPENPVKASVTDDHKAFVDIGIPSADLIIKFWNKPEEWPYHHTTEDNLAHISNESLKITGTTIEQFFYNVYHSNYSAFSQSNYPWRDDKPLNAPLCFLLILIISGALAGICFLRTKLINLITGN